jgi:hypothetical protein
MKQSQNITKNQCYDGVLKGVYRKPSVFNGKPERGHNWRDCVTSKDRLDQHNAWEWAWPNEIQSQ